MGLLVEYPWLAIGIAAAFAVIWHRKRNLATLTATALWALYAIYEYLTFARILCSGDCNIRVDLILLDPSLLLVSIGAILGTLWAKPSRPR
jgi:hypothetical protein